MEQARHNNRTRNAGLDVLRFIAVVLVIGRHAYPIPGVPFVEPLLAAWQRGGWVGVDLFFVLSGFLVSGLLFVEYQRHDRIRIGRFLMRRGWKIYPPFLVLIAATVVYRKIQQTGDHAQLAAELTFMQSYFPGLWPHTWSLSVEEHFYLLLPLVLTVIIARNRSTRNLAGLLRVLAFLSVFCLVARFVVAKTLPWSYLTRLYPSYLRLDALGFGVGISYFYHFHHERFVQFVMPRRVWLAVFGALLLVPVFTFDIGGVRPTSPRLALRSTTWQPG